MKVLVVGAGMYVTGRHGTGEGTILASLAQASKEVMLERVDVIARNPANKNIVEETVRKINGRIGSNLKTTYHSVSSVEDYLSQNKKYDAAIVSVPDDLHFEIGKAVLEKNIHCLMVKPLTPSVAEAQSLLNIQHARHLHAAVEFHKRFDESNRMVKRIISDGTVGNVRYFVINFSQRIQIPLTVFREWSARSNIFQYLGVHYVDLVYFLTGAIPKRAMAIGTKGVLSTQGINTIDSVHAFVEWSGGAGGDEPFITVMNISWIDPNVTSALSDQKFMLIGSTGRLDVDQKNRGIELVQEGPGIRHINPYFSDYLPTPEGGMEFQGYGYKSIRGFLDDLQELFANRISLAELEKKRPSFRQAMLSTAIVEAVNTSLKQNSNWVAIHDLP